MKSIKGRLLIGLLILFTALFTLIYIRTNTIEDALIESNQKGFTILHVEEIENGSMVLFTYENLDDLSLSVVQKSMGRNKVIYSGTQGELKKTLDTKGMSWCFMPGINGLSFPIYYGVIENSKLDQVKVIEKTSGIYANAKIIEIAGSRLWFVDMSEFKGGNFEIVGSTLDDENIISIEDSIEFLTLELKQ